ncbi:MAG: tyrosine-type recombinase/integrase [Rhodospirillales bacterium]|nr:tyrosine-type recombinase/integrase [Rhodospirillales bacterium]
MTVAINNAFIRKITAVKPEKVTEYRDRSLRGFIVRQQPSGFISYYAIAVKGSARRGNRRQKKIHIGEHPAISPSEARNAAEELIAKARLEVLPLKKERERWTLRQFLDQHYLPWAEQSLKDPAGQRGQLRRFADWDQLFLDEIDKRRVELWRTKRLANRVSPGTINRNVVVIRAVLSKAVEWDFLEHHPLAGLKKLKTDTSSKPRTLSEDDRTKLFEALEQRDRQLAEDRLSANRWREERGYEKLPELTYYGNHLTPIVMTAYHTGMRRGEIFSMQWSDVDLDAQLLTIRAENAKTSQMRTIPINDPLCVILSQWRAQSGMTDGYVFPGKGGARLDNFQNAWDKLRKDSGLRHLRFKDFRSDFGSRLANNGVDLSVTQRLLGHSSPVVTMRYYVKITEDTMREAVAVSSL